MPDYQQSITALALQQIGKKTYFFIVFLDMHYRNEEHVEHNNSEYDSLPHKSARSEFLSVKFV
jgi:hypothetical protein